jgi:type II secretory pathway component PulF
MNSYLYQAVDDAGRLSQGLLQATDPMSIEAQLQQKGLWPISIEHQKTKNTSQSKGNKTRVSKARGHKARRAQIEFFTIMAFQCRAGIPILQALEAASGESSHPGYQQVITSLGKFIEQGETLWEAIQRYPSHFAKSTVSIIRAGELSGQLPEAFDDLSEHLEWMDKMLAEIKQATIYPAIVTFVVMIFVLVLFSAVIPQFEKLLGNVNVPLPWLTVVIFNMSQLIKSSWPLWTSALACLFIGIPIGRRLNKRFEYLTDRLKFKLPLLGPLYHMLAISRFANHLSITTKSGIPILNALKLCEGLTGNVVLDHAIQNTRLNIEKGDQISQSMRKERVFPSILLRMVMVGERTGNLDISLQSVSGYYNTMIPRLIKKLFSIIEPAIILFLISVVGGVAVAVFMPMLSLMDNIK